MGGQAYHQRGVARGGNPRAFRQQQQRNARLDSWIRIPVLAQCSGRLPGRRRLRQLCVVLPKRKTVAVIQAMVSNMQKEMDDLFELIENLCHVDQTPAIIPAYEPLPDRQIVLHSQNYRLDSNPIGFTFLRLDVRDDAVHLHFSNGRKEELLSAGRGRWIRSVYTAPYRKPKLLGLMSQEAPEEVRVAACCEWTAAVSESSAVISTVRQTESIRLTFTPEGDAVHLRFEMTGYWDAVRWTCQAFEYNRGNFYRLCNCVLLFKAWPSEKAALNTPERIRKRPLLI